MKKIVSILLSILMIMMLIPFSVFAENTEEVFHIKSIKDWNELADKCELDSYSNNLIVELDNDLSFQKGFNEIPYFNGTFDGKNHKLENIVFDSSVINEGVFRITGKKAVIKNLSVEINANHKGNRFGFVGYNQGSVININVKGNIEASSEAGLIVGYNSVEGLVESCIGHGKINGKRYIGGLVGKNYGIVNKCFNNTNVNNEIQKEDLDISTLTLESLTNADDKTILSDIGGVAGTSFGTILDSRNNGTIGHEHVGYNVGGIVGSQSGYVANSINNGTILGRKEIGGIVGQMEPSMLLLYKEDYLQKMSKELREIHDSTSIVLDDLKEAKDVTTDSADDIVDDLKEAYEAVDSMIDHRHDTDKTKFNNAKNVLSSSLRDSFDSSKELVDYYKDSDDFFNQLDKVNDELQKFGDTSVAFADSLTQEKDMYQDVSNKDTDKNTEGKVYQCTNKGQVEGDINVGGITGSMAIENDLDPEDDFDVIGKTSLDATYQIRDVMDKCINYGTIDIKRNNAGGLCGRETVGLIKNGMNFAMIDNEEANCIGGIVGEANALIDKNYAKCFLRGNDYVGGIAGSATKASNNGSLVQILGHNASAGSIFGNYGKVNDEIVENVEEIENNWYVYDDLAAIDGISYDKKAYQISLEEMLEKDIDESLKKVNVIFMDEDKVVYKKTLNYGESMKEEDVPDEIIKDNEYRNWDNYDSKLLNNITKDILFTCSYNDVYPSISSLEEPLPYVVAIGEFTMDDVLSASTIKDKPVDSEQECITYIFDEDLSKDSFVTSYRFYANDFDMYKVFVKENDNWIEVQYKQDGRYACVEKNNIEEVSIVEVHDYTIYYEIGAGIVCLGIIILIIGKKKKKNNKQNKG